MPRFRGRTRWLLAAAAALVALGTAITVAIVRAYDWEKASSIVAVVSLPVAVLGCFLALLAISPGLKASDFPPRTLEQIVDQLAVAVQQQWESEADLRRVRDPYFLPISWHPADPELLDAWSSLEAFVETWPDGPIADRPGWASDPGELTGVDEKLADVVLRRIPTGRLVVLGEAGAGKTVLLVRLILEILASREHGQAIPVLLPMASWLSLEEDFRAWVERQLIQDYPALGKAVPGLVDGATVANALIRTRKVILILDGFDELSLTARRVAIQKINSSLQPGQTVVLASREAEYREAVDPSSSSPRRIAGAVGVSLGSLDATAAAEYLRQDAWDRSAAARWDPVIEQLSRNSPLASAFRTPLMVGLARTIYNPRPDELPSSIQGPQELCELSTEEAIVEHLFDAYIAAAYRGSKRWPADKAERWLRFLARHLNDRTPAATDLKWWELREAIPRYSAGAVAGMLAGVATAFVVAFGRRNLGIGIGMGLLTGLLTSYGCRLAVGAKGGLAQAFAGGVVGGLLGGILGGLADGFITGASPDLTIGLIGGTEVGLGVAVIGRRTGGFVGGLTGGIAVAIFAGRSPGVAGAVLDGLAVALVVGLTVELEGQRVPSKGFREVQWSPVGLIAGLGVGIAVGLNAGLSVTLGLIVGTLTGLATGVVAGLDGASVDLLEATSPAVSFRRDRGSFWSTGAATALALGLTVGVGIQPPVGIAAGFSFGIVVAFLQASSGAFGIARFQLALRGHLPFRVMDFLVDAHTRGVLRQVGAVYQFRHTDLQRRLAARPPSEEREV